MWRVTGVSAWLAILIVSALSVVVLPTKVIAGSLTSSVDRTDEPFGLPTIRKENYAILAARLVGSWLTLHNLHMVIVEDQQVRDYYRPIFLIDQAGIKRYFGAPSASNRSRKYERGVGPILHWALEGVRPLRSSQYQSH